MAELLTEKQAKARAAALNKHLRAQGSELVVTHRHGHVFLVHKRLPPRRSAEGAVIDISPPLRKMEKHCGLPVGPSVYSLGHYFAVTLMGKQTEARSKRHGASPFKHTRLKDGT
jgi:hypothetical protein